MTKKIFSSEDIEKLLKNRYVLNVTEKSITYSPEFKVHYLLEYSKGKNTKDIFIESGFDINILGESRIESTGYRWRRAYNSNKGIKIL